MFSDRLLSLDAVVLHLVHDSLLLVANLPFAYCMCCFMLFCSHILQGMVTD
jgi:hypothetical protein